MQWQVESNTISKVASNTVSDPVTLALGALVWVLEDDSRAQRLLDLTGISPEQLRSSASDPATLTALLDFLSAHEPDLVGAAEALNVSPAELIAARELVSA